jgi:hypothetical protein
MTLSTTSLDGSSIVRPSQSLQLFKLILPNSHAGIIRHQVDFDFCYCSLNGTCWKFHATPGRTQANSPQPVQACIDHDQISSPVKVFRIP